MINYFEEDIKFKLKEKRIINKWFKSVVENEKFKLGDLNYIFCSDKYLLEINQNYLNHDTYTDIITFDNSDEDKKIEGDIFISVERIIENAKDLNVEFEIELKRVLIHGLLHLCGYKDKTKEEKQKMRELETFYIEKYKMLHVEQ
ncbi:MAG: rRNA maturation RNase YbeY [Bacteroidia bacterium]|nr:rRNA maturation RNase YbeY [Bacteroidia bacterium]